MEIKQTLTKRNLIALGLAILSSGAQAADIATFGDWSIWENDQTGVRSIYTQFQAEDGTHYNINVDKSAIASILICGYNETTTGNFKQAPNIVANVNGTNVLMAVYQYDGGCAYAEAISKAGNTHITNEFYVKRSVLFTMTNGHWFRFSADGVQKAWAALNNIQPAKPKPKQDSTKQLFLKGGAPI